MAIYKVTIWSGHQVGRFTHNTYFDDKEWLQHSIARYIEKGFDLTKPSTTLTIEIEMVKDDTP